MPSLIANCKTRELPQTNAPKRLRFHVAALSEFVLVISHRLLSLVISADFGSSVAN
jgi:hypothetical protein